MKTQKEKISLLEEKLNTMCDESKPSDEREEELEQRCSQLASQRDAKAREVEQLKC
jgi:hypothetical protein